jgi:23S rRNA-/tRNA-specific pseudouridylate synthase
MSDLDSLDVQRIESSFFSRLWRWRITADDARGQTCLDELRDRLPHIDPASWGERFDLGGVYLNRNPAGPLDPLAEECLLEYYEPRFEPSRARDYFPQFGRNMVLFEDEDLGVVFKPAGLPTYHCRDQRRHNLFEYLSVHFGRKVHLPSRLDTGVAGLLLVSFSERMNRYCQKAHERRRLAKTYIAECSGSADWQTINVTLPLARDERHPILRKVSPDGEHAHTRLTKLGAISAPGSMPRVVVRAEPLTGRTHQIRVHCQSQGVPVVGDPYYGGECAGELRLVSYSLGFVHPYRNEPLSFVMPESLRPEWLREAIRLCGGAMEHDLEEES